MTFFSHLICSECRESFDPRELQTYCSKCEKPLLASYDLQKAKTVLRKSDLAGREPSLWRYRELLPVFQERHVVTLGEGYTPLIPLQKLSSKLGLTGVWLKDESQIPTGSFKARGLSVAVSKAAELWVKHVAIPSAGNAAGALAAYAARAGMRCSIFMPEDTPEINILESRITGAHVTLIDGLISDCGRKVAEGKEATGWFDMSTLKEPYRLEGKKTMGLELAEQFSWRLPDVVIYPTGGGTGLIGMWKAFAELQELGWIEEHKPKMVAVQSTGCDPITRAFKADEKTSIFYRNAATIASGLRVPKAFGDTLILEALKESGGTAISVSDEDILKSMVELARVEGVFVCPEGAATFAALRQLKDSGLVGRNDKIVLFNTGAGLKYPEVVSAYLSKNSNISS